MTVSQTSKQSYTQLKAAGKLSALERAVCDILNIKHLVAGAVYQTRREVADKLNEQASTISGTVNGLIRKGAIAEGGNVPCKVTGRSVRSIALVVDAAPQPVFPIHVVGTAKYEEHAIPDDSRDYCKGCAGDDDGIVCGNLPHCGPKDGREHHVVFVKVG
jgi:hypothetical protein